MGEQRETTEYKNIKKGAGKEREQREGEHTEREQRGRSDGKR